MLENAATLTLILLVGIAFTPASNSGPDGPEADVIVVEMIEKSATSYAFEPAEIDVRPGMIVRFVQAGVVPHNVEFKETPEGTDLGEARMGPFLLQKGETYELTIDERFAEGEYRFVCTPHEAMGMIGSLTVTSGR